MYAGQIISMIEKQATEDSIIEFETTDKTIQIPNPKNAEYLVLYTGEYVLQIKTENDLKVFDPKKILSVNISVCWSLYL